jgi:hypothetical protein
MSCLLQVRVLGEGYTPDDEEDSAVAEVANVFVYQVRGVVEWSGWCSTWCRGAGGKLGPGV